MESFTVMYICYIVHSSYTLMFSGLDLWPTNISQIYLLDIYIFYTLMAAVYGFLVGASARLGEVLSLSLSHLKNFVEATKRHSLFFFLFFCFYT